MKYLTVATMVPLLFCSYIYAQNNNTTLTHINMVNNGVAIDTVKKASYPIRHVDDSKFFRDITELKFEDLQTQLNKDIATAKRKRQATNEMERQLEECVKGLNYLKGTDEVIVIDSMVVDKEKFLSAYKFSPELGKIKYGENKETTVFETERGNRIYGAVKVNNDSVRQLRLVSYYKDNETVSKPYIIEGLGVEGDMNYPFMMTDGVTFYFAARTEDGLGNYDIYATRYDSEGDRFYKAENMGFPYNSYANDYMMVIDEENGVGWFASDRYQPANKVCVYTFIPNSSRHAIDYENTDKNVVSKAASLRPIRATWTAENEEKRIATRQRLSLLILNNDTEQENDFTLVINDLYTYTRYSQFQSKQAKSACMEWMEKKKNYDALSLQLDDLRDAYSSATTQKRKELKQRILDLERWIEGLAKEVAEAEKKTRNIEIETLNK